MIEFYTVQDFPHFVVRSGPWDIMRDDNDNCAAIPNEDGMAGGNRASHYGNMGHVRHMQERGHLPYRDPAELTDSEIDEALDRDRYPADMALTGWPVTDRVIENSNALHREKVRRAK